MHEGSPNPYQAPTSSGQSQAYTFKTGVVVACILWALLSVATWLGGTVLGPLYQDWELELPLLSRMVLHPAFPLALAIATILLGLAAVYANPRQRYWMANLSLLFVFALALVTVISMFAPLVMLIVGLSES